MLLMDKHDHVTLHYYYLPTNQSTKYFYNSMNFLSIYSFQFNDVIQETLCYASTTQQIKNNLFQFFKLLTIFITMKAS
jgi:hypothetical protein